jgi:Alkylmercury lyase
LSPAAEAGLLGREFGVEEGMDFDTQVKLTVYHHFASTAHAPPVAHVAA